MSLKDSSGPAFLQKHDDDFSFGYEGLSVRDYFAAKALPAVLAEAYASGDVDDMAAFARGCAREAYVIADAMLKARES